MVQLDLRFLAYHEVAALFPDLFLLELLCVKELVGFI
jgi:hypothetical protein